MSIIFRAIGDRDVVDFLEAYPEKAQQAIRAKLEEQAAAISARVKQKLSGEVLNRKSGKLVNSIYARVYYAKDKITLSLSSRGDVPYARAYEQGAYIGSYIIQAKSKTLRFVGKSGFLAYAAEVRFPGRFIQGLGFIEGTMQEMLPDLRMAVIEGALSVGPRGGKVR